MNNIFDNVRSEHILSILNYILEHSPDSRVRIADATGLSFVTVGKVCDTLVDINILKQATTRDSRARRKTRLLYAKPFYWLGIYTIAKDRFRFNIFDLSLKCVRTYTYIPEDSVFADSQLCDFFRSASEFAIFHKFKSDRCIATAVMVPGEYSAYRDRATCDFFPHLDSIRLKETLREYSFGTEPSVVTESSVSISAIRNELSDGQNVFALFLNKGCIQGAYITPDTLPHSSLADTGLIKGRDNLTLNTVSRITPDPDKFFESLSDVIFTLSNTVPLSKIIVCGNIYSDINCCATVLHDALFDKYSSFGLIPPDVLPYDPNKISEKAISREIRNRWFCREILKEDSPRLLTNSLNLL